VHRSLVLAFALAACGKSGAPTPGQVVERGWDAHEAVVAAGEHAASCPEVGAAMRRALGEHHAALADAFELDRDPAQLEKLVDFLEAHQDRLDELARRSDALRARCPDDASVTAAFHDLQVP
jgi:hypothetical protein